VIELLNKQDAAYDFLEHDGTLFWFKTDLNAPKGRIIAIDVQNPAEIKEVVPETNDKLEKVDVVGERFVANYLKDAHSVVRLFELSGKPAGEIPLPGLGTAGGFSGKRKDTENVLFLRQLHRAADDLPLRFQGRPKQRALSPESRFQIGRLHNRAGFFITARTAHACRCS